MVIVCLSSYIAELWCAFETDAMNEAAANKIVQLKHERLCAVFFTDFSLKPQ
jgi:hypothetical protein